MASFVKQESGAEVNFQGGSSGQRFQSSESLDEWRSSDQVQNGTPSTSPYWDSDDEDGGPSPSDLYGKYTWKIDKFSEINKREVRSDTFEAGGLKWYILIYPKGCDVYNHLSLFLCVANYDKLLPGWSHSAQFTIALFNKDPKKSKFSDTLHRFWKKEHDWGWKKFMELSRVVEEFVDADTLIIEAQVQVIRERADRPFRCLGYQYRRELVRHYLPNIEQIFKRFMEERQIKIDKLIKDKARWSSFCSFWRAMDQSSRCCMTRVKTDAILKVVVKNFYIEKEVTSTLVMHTLYTGLKALEGQSKAKKRKSKHTEADYLLIPLIQMEEDAFVLVDDVLPLLERAAREPWPKEERGQQYRLQDESVGEDSYKKASECDERRLTFLGRRIIEIFVLAHVFSKIEVAYQEAVALKRQEELIQEEAALLAISNQKGRCGGADKEKKSKKKQGKQKRKNRKGKDKGKDDKSSRDLQGKNEQYSSVVEGNDALASEPEITHEKTDAVEDISDASDSIDCVPEIIPQNSEDIDNSEMHLLPTEVTCVQNGTEGRSSSVMGGDSSSTCSSDSFTTVVIKKPQNGNSRHKKLENSVSREKNHRNTVVSDSVDRLNGEANKSCRPVTDARNQFEKSRSSHTAVSLSEDRIVNGAELHAVKKEENPVSLSTEAINMKVSLNPEFFVTSPPKIPLQKPSSGFPTKSESKANADQSSSPLNSVQTSPTLRSDTQILASPEPTENSLERQVRLPSEKPLTTQVTATTEKPSMSLMPDLSRPLSAPITTEPRLIASTVSMVQTEPLLSRSVSFAGRFGPEPSVSTAQSFIPQSYRNAIIGQSYTQSHPNTSSVVNASLSYAQATSLASSPMIHPHMPDRIIDPNNMNPSFSFGMVNRHRDVLQNGPLWNESTQRGSTRSLPVDHQSSLSELQSFDLYNARVTRSQDTLPSGFSAGTSGRQSNVTEEFPHIDIINDLLDDEHGIGKLSMLGSSNHGNFSNGIHYIDRQYSFPGEVSSGPGPSTNASRFVRTRSFYDNDGLHHDYGASGSIYDAIPQVSPRQPRNGYIGGLLANQRQLNGSDLPYNTNADSNSYHTTDYQQLSLGSNGYTVYRPSNGL